MDPTNPLTPAPRSSLQKLTSGFAWLASITLIGLVMLYQKTLRYVLGGRCRFEPSCSDYFIQAVRKHGPVKGAAKGLYRIWRCQPFYPGGFDPP